MRYRFSRRFSLLGLAIELESNVDELLQNDEYFLSKGAQLHSLLSNFHELVPDPDTGSDFGDILRIEIEQADGADTLTCSREEDGSYRFRGPLLTLERGCRDKRASIFGNMGILSKIFVLELERRGIFSFHSTSFVVPGSDRLILVLGGSGAGKSTVLLKALIDGMEVFGTELTHLQCTEEGVRFFKGSLWQNCRMGNLVEDFPVLLERFGIVPVPAGNPWKQYRSIDLRPWQHPSDLMVNPRVTILIPRIEQERTRHERFRIKPEEALSSMYENLSDKVSPPSNVYHQWFVPSLDSGEDQVRRWNAARAFLDSGAITDIWKSMTSPAACLDEVLVNTGRAGI